MIVVYLCPTRIGLGIDDNPAGIFYSGSLQQLTTTCSKLQATAITDCMTLFISCKSHYTILGQQHVFLCAFFPIKFKINITCVWGGAFFLLSISVSGEAFFPLQDGFLILFIP